MNKFSQYRLNKFIHSILTTYAGADVELPLAPGASKLGVNRTSI